MIPLIGVTGADVVADVFVGAGALVFLYGISKAKKAYMRTITTMMRVINLVRLDTRIRLRQREDQE